MSSRTPLDGTSIFAMREMFSSFVVELVRFDFERFCVSTLAAYRNHLGDVA